MKKHLSSITLSLFFISYSFSQVPAIRWQTTIGSNGYDPLAEIVQTTDGNYYVGCANYEDASGDKAENPLGYSNDYWILKLSPTGDILWQNTIGGSRGDGLSALDATDDGGVILGGSSASAAGIDKTESSFLNNMGELTSDYWVVKLNSSGMIEWQNNIGGKAEDVLTSIQQTSDGGYIVGGYSKSGTSGDKTEINIGDYAYWILKLNSTGGIVWQNTIDGINSDILKCIRETSDGGFIVGGHSRSGISGEKTEACFSDSYDYWVLKLNSSGAIIWQNTIGGNSDEELSTVHEAADGGYIVCGTSQSNATGDKTEPNFGSTDLWIVKLNVSGAIVWQNTIGGNGTEGYPDIQAAVDGGYYLCASSGTNLSADKTVPAVESDDYWLMKLNSSGNILWQDVYGGFGYDRFRSLDQTSDGGVILAGFSNSDIGGDKTENAVPTEYGSASDDFWIIKLMGTSCVPSTEVCNGLDDDCDGSTDEDIVVTSVTEATASLSFCNGGFVPLYVTYSGFSTLQWKRNGTNIPDATNAVYIATMKGTYSCRVTNSCGNAISAGIYVNVQKIPSASITAGGPVVFCEGGSVLLTANTGGGLSYQWLKNDVDIIGATNINYTATTAGTYTCRVIKTATGCNKTSNPVTVSVPCRESDVSDGSESDLFNVYPNPVTNYLTVALNSPINDNASLVILNLSGELISQFEITSPEVTVDISNYSRGLYFIQVIIDGQFSMQKFIIQ